MAYQPNTLQGANSTGYSVVYGTSIPAYVVSIYCRGGEYWLRPSFTATTKATTSGANTNVTSPVNTPLTAGWLHVLGGDNVSLGVDNGLPGSEPIVQLDIWCVTGGAGNELVINAH